MASITAHSSALLLDNSSCFIASITSSSLLIWFLYTITSFDSTFLLTMFLIFFTLVAQSKLFFVSDSLQADGEQLTNISVFAVPPSESFINFVRTWLRYGMNLAPSDSAAMTFPKALKLKLIAFASSQPASLVPVLEDFSLPARSTKESLPIVLTLVCTLVLSISILKIRCDLLLASFISVFRVLRPAKPASKISSV